MFIIHKKEKRKKKDVYFLILLINVKDRKLQIHSEIM